MRTMSVIISICLTLISLNGTCQESFKEKQMTYERVRSAYDTKYDDLRLKLQESNIDINTVEIYIRGFKKDKELEVWARNKGDAAFINVLNYRICALSGEPGPKRRQGDRQVPEGFYHIEIFNPWSNFYLSMGLNYPNTSDLILGAQGNPGGDIYIHGSCATIGCLPITDRYIKELYVLCVEAKSNGQRHIPVHLFPARMDANALTQLNERYNPEESTRNLWNELQIAFEYFEEKRDLPKITFLRNGKHLIESP